MKSNIMHWPKVLFSYASFVLFQGLKTGCKWVYRSLYLIHGNCRRYVGGCSFSRYYTDFFVISQRNLQCVCSIVMLGIILILVMDPLQSVYFLFNGVQ
jgi:hypothetical protein